MSLLSYRPLSIARKPFWRDARTALALAIGKTGIRLSLWVAPWLVDKDKALVVVASSAADERRPS